MIVATPESEISDDSHCCFLKSETTWRKYCTRSFRLRQPQVRSSRSQGSITMDLGLCLILKDRPNYAGSPFVVRSREEKRREDEIRFGAPRLHPSRRHTPVHGQSHNRESTWLSAAQAHKTYNQKSEVHSLVEIRIRI